MEKNLKPADTLYCKAKHGPYILTYKAYFCKAKPNLKASEYAISFGGAFRPMGRNEFAHGITGCPEGHQQFKIGQAPFHTTLCFTKDFNHATDFGGIYACEDDNKCPPREGQPYVKYYTSKGKNKHECEYYCVFPGLLRELKFAGIQLPPYDV